LQKDFVFAACISTRFSTELLKTFTQNLYFSRGWAMEWFRKCVAAFSTIFFGSDREFSVPKKNLSRGPCACGGCAGSYALAIVSYVAAKCSVPK